MVTSERLARGAEGRAAAFKATAALSVLSLCALTGCFTSAPRISQEGGSAAPVCSTDCDAKWAAARTFVLAHSHYRLQTYSPDYLVTYSATSTSEMALSAEVNREPLPGGGSRIVARFWCANMFGCVPDATATLNDFNRTVGGGP
jgi:hypothetical protein